MGLVSSLFRVHDAVIEVSRAAAQLWRPRPMVRSEKALWRSLVLCILTTQQRYEAAVDTCRELENEGLLAVPKGRTEALRLLSGFESFFDLAGKNECLSRTRFPNRKRESISKTLWQIYVEGDGLHSILKANSNATELRRLLTDYCHGVGPKQASMFLRNIGYEEDLAILDKHVLDYMSLMSIAQSGMALKPISRYEEQETHLRGYGECYGVSLPHLDLGIWVTMRVMKRR
jgi:N-glycosylase/DNA lyase